MTWNLNSVTFTDGTAAKGSIVMDPAVRVASDFSVTTEAGALSAFTFSKANSGLYFGVGAGPNNFILFTNTGDRYFNFSFTSPLNAAGGRFALNTASSYECTNCGQFRFVTAGSLTTVQAAELPEPGTLSLVLAPLALLGAMRRRRSLKTAATQA
ncbi:MAG: hypothetical protein JWQ80_2731 [Massilia sp.]|nr:hypothetical protein [Massilia sp.]